jgi:hypothetical protein
VGQGSALSPILSALCLAPLLKEFERRVHVVVLISYVKNGTIIVQSDAWDKNLVKLKLAYKIVFELTQSMGLVLEHSKPEGFHFSQKHGDSNPDIDLGYAPYTGTTPLQGHRGTVVKHAAAVSFLGGCALPKGLRVQIPLTTCYLRHVTRNMWYSTMGDSPTGAWTRIWEVKPGPYI